MRGEHIDIASDVWDVQASYIAQAAIQATLTFRPEKIVFGGGVMAQIICWNEFIVCLKNY